MGQQYAFTLPSLRYSSVINANSSLGYLVLRRDGRTGEGLCFFFKALDRRGSSGFCSENSQQQQSHFKHLLI